MKLYQENGYVNMRAIIQTGLPFIFCVGGRGTGKTFNALDVLIEDQITFLFMRRKQEQIDLINKPEFSPFTSLARAKGIQIGLKKVSKRNSGIYKQIERDGELESEGSPLGFTCALSTIANMRGFNADDVQILLYDEFIGEEHEIPIRNEGAAFFNAYETVNRNRELFGRKPLQALLLANANDLANPIFVELNLVGVVDKMLKSDQEIYINRERGIGIFILQHSPISDQKKNTALYRVTGNGSDFYKMSISNKFTTDDMDSINSRPLREYSSLVSVGEICIYKHKSAEKFYVSQHISGTPEKFGSSESELQRFCRAYGWLWFSYLDRQIDFENYLCKILLTKYLK